MTIDLDRHMQAPASVREAARRVGGWHPSLAVDERTLLWRKWLSEYTRPEIRNEADAPNPDRR